MCTTSVNSLFFDKDFVTEDLDHLPWPVTLCNRNGTVLFKNRCAYQMKQFRVRSKTNKLIRESLRKDYLRALSQREIKLFECDAPSGFCYAVTAPTPDGNVAVFWAINSFLYYSILQAGAYDEEFARFRDSDSLIRMYADACIALQKPDNSLIDEALIHNELRFSRASRHFSNYAKIMIHSTGSDKKSLFLPTDLCRELTDYFAGLIASLGYRLSFSSDIPNAAVVLSKEMFVSTFLQILSVVLRMAEDNSAQVHLSEFDGYYHFQYFFKPSELLPILKKVTAAEIRFAQMVCEHQGWRLTEPHVTATGECMCSFSVPVQTQFRYECHEDESSMSDYCEMAREEASLITPVK